MFIESFFSKSYKNELTIPTLWLNKSLWKLNTKLIANAFCHERDPFGLTFLIFHDPSKGFDKACNFTD